MGQYQTADGRWKVGLVNDQPSDYNGFLGWRDCVIQLTGSGATPESVNYLNAFRDYAFAHNALDEPIMPPSVNVWISNNGVTSAVQADDLSVDGSTFTIGGIKWTGSAWDYSNAGQSSGSGGSSGGVLVVNVTDEVDPGTGYVTSICDKTAGEMMAAAPAICFIAPPIDGFSHVAFLEGFGFGPDYGYGFTCVLRGSGVQFSAETTSDYPKADGIK